MLSKLCLQLKAGPSLGRYLDLQLIVYLKLSNGLHAQTNDKSISQGSLKQAVKVSMVYRIKNEDYRRHHNKASMLTVLPQIMQDHFLYPLQALLSASANSR